MSPCLVSAILLAVQRATSLIDEGVRGAQERLGQLFKHLQQLGFLQGTHYEQSSLFRQIHTDLRQVTQGVGGLQQASYYLSGVSQAGTDAATRAVRLQMERFRAETVRGVFSIPESEQNSRLEQGVVRLPFTPSSLFGGRFQAAVNLLGEERDRQEQFARMSAQHSGTGKLLGRKRKTTPSSFPGEGDLGPPSEKRKRKKKSKNKRFRGQRGGGNNAPGSGGGSSSSGGKPRGGGGGGGSANHGGGGPQGGANQIGGKRGGNTSSKPPRGRGKPVGGNSK